MSVPKFRIEIVRYIKDENVKIYFDDLKLESFWMNDPGGMIEDVPSLVKKIAATLDIEIEITEEEKK